MGLALRWWAFFGILGIAGTAATMILKPAWLGFERKAFVASHQYQEAVNDALGHLRAEAARVNVEIAKAKDNPELQAALRGQLDAINVQIRMKEAKKQ